MRVAYICADPGIPVFGSKGASIHVQEVIRSLLRRGARVTLFAQRPEGEPPPDLRSLEVTPLPPLPASGAAARATAALAANRVLPDLLARSGPFDLLYERYSLWSHAGMAFARRNRIRRVLEVNAPLIEEQRQYRELPLRRQAERVIRSLLADAATIVAVSPGVKAYLDAFPESGGRAVVVSNGVDLARFPAARPPRPGGNTIGFLGSMKPWHGVDRLIDAFALLHRRGRHGRLLVVGDGGESAPLLEKVTRDNLLPFTRFTGAVAPHRVPALLAEMDIAVAPYPRLAGFYFSPLKIYEYMAAGLPVVATRVGHLHEVLEEGRAGLLVPPDDPAALCEALIALLDDDALRQTLGQAGRALVAQRYGWDAIVGRILSLADAAGEGRG
ncbi:glycosyltransferase family 4 protein [Brenneria corticis]|uniref:Glycosyl transferase family 1 n=1 Tax=Brenneria corticis TaxID=2173106 RepID=A0A2U1TYR5_9GAMM|nr:glycosyltransferase family 4 protein [Brenneria sp. CFCC 11842]PWC14530.1 glycosyl transferase family 1 [Brenneria sp. CFCC 11842]